HGRSVLLIHSPSGCVPTRSMPWRIVWIGSQASAMRQGAVQLCWRSDGQAVGEHMPGMEQWSAVRLRALAIVLALLCALAAGCARTPPEQALRDAFGGLQAAIESRDAGDVAGFLAEDFIGPGGLDREG